MPIYFAIGLPVTAIVGLLFFYIMSKKGMIYDSLGDYIGCGIGMQVLSFILFVFSCLLVMGICGPSQEYTYTTNINMAGIKTGSFIQGSASFFLFAGNATLEESEYYTYYEKLEDGSHWKRKIPAEWTKVYETNDEKPHVEITRRVWKFPAWFTGKLNEEFCRKNQLGYTMEKKIFVPIGSIKFKQFEVK